MKTFKVGDVIQFPEELEVYEISNQPVTRCVVRCKINNAVDDFLLINWRFRNLVDPELVYDNDLCRLKAITGKSFNIGIHVSPYIKSRIVVTTNKDGKTYIKDGYISIRKVLI